MERVLGLGCDGRYPNERHQYWHNNFTKCLTYHEEEVPKLGHDGLKVRSAC